MSMAVASACGEDIFRQYQYQERRKLQKWPKGFIPKIQDHVENFLLLTLMTMKGDCLLERCVGREKSLFEQFSSLFGVDVNKNLGVQMGQWVSILENQKTINKKVFLFALIFLLFALTSTKEALTSNLRDAQSCTCKMGYRRNLKDNGSVELASLSTISTSQLSSNPQVYWVWKLDKGVIFTYLSLVQFKFTFIQLEKFFCNF